MAEKKSSGKGKKILIIAIVLVLIVGLVLGLVFLLPKGKSTADNFKEVASITIADNEEAKADYALFETKVDETEGVKHYAAEIDALRLIVVAADEVVDFYNEYYVFAENNSYNGEIEAALSQIKDSQKNLNSIMTDAKPTLVDAGISHVQNVWIDYRVEYLNFVQGMQKLFANMNKAYHEAMGNATVTNAASRAILNTIDSYMTVIVRDVQKLVDINVKGSKSETYTLGNLDAKALSFALFVVRNIQDRSNIESYYVDMPMAYTTISNFESKFNQGLDKVLDSLELDLFVPEVTYENELTTTDQEAAEMLELVKKFIVGGEV